MDRSAPGLRTWPRVIFARRLGFFRRRGVGLRGIGHAQLGRGLVAEFDQRNITGGLLLHLLQRLLEGFSRPFRVAVLLPLVEGHRQQKQPLGSWRRQVILSECVERPNARVQLVAMEIDERLQRLIRGVLRMQADQFFGVCGGFFQIGGAAQFDEHTNPPRQELRLLGQLLPRRQGQKVRFARGSAA